MNLILEVNSRGSWARVGEFDGKLLPSVRQAALQLDRVFTSGIVLRESSHGPSWRVIKTGGGRSPKVVWRFG